jgi:UDP-N-acetyl-D-glucosamine dehydrogenase
MEISVLGQGYVGFPLSIELALKNHTVIGFDNNESKVLNLQNGITDIPGVNSNDLRELVNRNKYIPTLDPTLLSDSDIIILAVPTPLDEFGNPDTSFLEIAAKTAANYAKDKSLIINESTSYPGTLRNLIKPIFDKHSKNTFLFASAPERVDPANLNWDLKNTPRVIAGLSDEATDKAVSVYSIFCNQIHRASSPEVAEASKIFENTFRMVNIALVNEFALIADKIGFSTQEAISAASTKPFGFMPFYPSIGVGGHCIPVDPKYLSYLSKSVGANSDLIDLAHKINSEMPKNTAQKIKVEIGGDLSNKRIQVAGIAYKPNVPDVRESPALQLIKELKNLGASVSWHDPVVIELNGEKSSILDTGIDLGLILTPHTTLDLTPWKLAKTRVIDLSANGINYGWPKLY